MKIETKVFIWLMIILFLINFLIGKTIIAEQLKPLIKDNNINNDTKIIYFNYL